jgi:hypothetical protein
MNDAALRKTLTAMLKSHRAQMSILRDLVARIDAIEASIQGLDPTFRDVLTVRLQETKQKAEAIYAGAIDAIDGAISRVKNGGSI